MQGCLSRWAHKGPNQLVNVKEIVSTVIITVSQKIK